MTHTQPTHWFAASCVNWETGLDLRDVLTRLRRRDNGAGLKTNCDVIIYRVPLDVDAEYQIDHFRPVVEGAEFIGHANTVWD